MRSHPSAEKLTDAQRLLWDAYIAAESRAPRPEKLLALNAFLDALSASPPSEWFAWARLMAEQVVDQGLNLVIRRPLFERAIFPALLAGYRARLPGAARWLAGLNENLQGSSWCRDQLQPDERTELGLLKAAIKHDPEDRRSRQRLINVFADRLRYSLHELPSGVLHGMDGATPEQCRELEEELNEFCRLIADEEMGERYGELIRACRFHFRAYRDYVLHREEYGSYATYISEHPE
jgi:hypothetical protein